MTDNNICTCQIVNLPRLFPASCCVCNMHRETHIPGDAKFLNSRQKHQLLLISPSKTSRSNRLNCLVICIHNVHSSLVQTRQYCHDTSQPHVTKGGLVLLINIQFLLLAARSKGLHLIITAAGYQPPPPVVFVNEDVYRGCLPHSTVVVTGDKTRTY